MEHWLCIILVGFLYKGNCEESISPFSDAVLALEGNSVTLSCKYSERAISLHWYQQHPRSSPQFLISDLSGNTSQHSVHQEKDMRRFHLEISSAALTDSALYYCALQPTVTGNTHTLYKNQRAWWNGRENTNGVWKTTGIPIDQTVERCWTLLFTLH